MKCNNTNAQNYKKSFFQKFLDFFKISKEIVLTDKEAEYVDKHFDDFPVFRKRK